MAVILPEGLGTPAGAQGLDDLGQTLLIEWSMYEWWL